MAKLEEIMQIKFADEEFGRAFKEIYAAAKLAAQIPINIKTVPELSKVLNLYAEGPFPCDAENPFEYRHIEILNQILDLIPIDVIKNNLATVVKDPINNQYRFGDGEKLFKILLPDNELENFKEEEIAIASINLTAGEELYCPKCALQIGLTIADHGRGQFLIIPDEFNIQSVSSIVPHGYHHTSLKFSINSHKKFSVLGALTKTELYGITNKETGIKSVIFALQYSSKEKPIKLAEVELPQNLIPAASAQHDLV